MSKKEKQSSGNILPPFLNLLAKNFLKEEKRNMEQVMSEQKKNTEKMNGLVD